MRPVQLRLAGLHSYAEPVVVDFEELGRYGLFGIFGPIGSGKSTLLDALTLALYGLVDRAAGRSRRGLLNPRCDRLEVALRFGVAGADGTRTQWEVQRSFRRDDRGLKRIGSRLARIDGDDHLVVADKERELAEAVHELVGLGAQDFMRAVVLPQGRFMEFLHLKGSDRRAMLQRIFKLGAFGVGLRDQVRTRDTRTRTDLAACTGELAGIGDASPAAVRRAGVLERKQARRLDAARRALDAATAVVERVEAQSAARERRAAAQEAHRAHLASAADIEALQERVRTSEAHAPVAPAARRWAATRAQAERADREAAQHAGVAAGAVAGREAAAEAQRALEQRARGEDPALRSLLKRLEEGLALRQEEAGVASEAAALAVRASELQAALSERAEARARAGEAIAAVEAERAELTAAWDACQVDAGRRASIQRAERAADRLARARSEEREAIAAAEAAAERCAAARAQTAEADAASAVARDALERAAEQARAAERDPALCDPEALDARRSAAASAALTAARARQLREAARAAAADAAGADQDVGAATAARRVAQDAHARAQQVLRQAERALANARADADAAAARAGAGALAAELKDGAPCPVCGSAEHPAPAAPFAPDAAALRAHTLGRARALERLEQTTAALGAAEQRLADAAERAAAALAAADAAAELDLACSAELPPLVRDAEDPVAAAAELEARTRADQGADRAARGRLERTRTAAEAARLAVERAEAPRTALAALYERALEEHAALLAVHEQRSQESGAAWDELDRARGPLTLLEIPAAAKRLAEADRRAQEFRARVRSCDERLAELRAAPASAPDAETELARSLAQAEAQLEALHQRQARLRERLSEHGPSGSPAEVEAALTALADARQEAATALEEAQARAESAGHRQAALQATAQATAETHRAATAELEALTDDVAPEAIAALLAELLDDDALGEARARISAWAERAAVLQAEAERTAAEVDDASLPDEAAVQAQWAAARATHAEAAAEAHAAAAEHARLEAVAPRHAELEARRRELELELSRLTHLSRLLRGDRFVEFVANDYLEELAHDASAHLLELTRDRYRLELDHEGGFQVRDLDAGGAQRPVTSLSGGETFLTSLALALALSSQVQRRSARSLEFFFLDEGFGTLDAEALDRVLTAIESLRGGARMIGLISHLPAVRERVPRYLEVLGPDVAGGGTRVRVCDA